MHPEIMAGLAHIKLVAIHPFVDGNGRTARLLMNLLLMQYGYPIAVVGCESDERRRYYQALDRAHLEGVTDDFVQLIAELVLQTMRKYIGLIPVGK